MKFSTAQIDKPSKEPTDRGPVRAFSMAARGGGGYLLVEYLIYIAVLAVVMEVAFSAFFRCLDSSRDLARNSEDILRVLRVGELWRADVRDAAAPPEFVTGGDLSACEIPKTNSRVAYVFSDGSIWRKEGEAAAKEVLPRVKESRIVKDQRQRVVSWRWEIELSTRKKVVRMRPLFTFQAVPAKPMP